MSILPLVSGYARAAPACYVRGDAWSVEAFVSAARALARELPAARCALLLCQDRVNFALALAALLIRRTSALLPPSHARIAIADIVAARQPGYALVDARGYAELPEFVVRWPGPIDASGEVPAIDGDHVAAVVYTSGTTGAPEPHEKRWSSLVRGADALRERVGLRPGEAIVGAVPPQHMWGLEATIMLPLMSGGVIHPATPLLPQDLATQLAQAAAPRWLVLTPVHARACVRTSTRLPPLAGVLSATSPFERAEAQAFERLSGVSPIEIYGSSETGAIATRRPSQDERFTPLREVSLEQTEAGLHVRGGHVAPVVLRDRADVAGDGRFALLGRDADQVKVGGKRASLAMLNAALRSIPGVVDAEYVRLEPTGLAPRLGALAVAPGLDRDAILAALRERIDPVFLPRPLHLVDALPRNAVGKLPAASLAARIVDASKRGDAEERNR